MFLRNKLTISLIILALVLIAGDVWYSQKPAPVTPPVVSDNKEQVVDKTGEELSGDGVDTSDWKTYRNEKLGFELQMPPKWQVSGERYETVLFSEGGPVGDLVTLFNTEKNTYGVHIYRISNSPKKSVLDFFEYAHSGDKVPDPIIENIVLGRDNLKFTLLYTKNTSNDFFSKHFIRLINGNYFEIMYFNPGVEELNKQIDKMLNTLKFY